MDAVEASIVAYCAAATAVCLVFLYDRFKPWTDYTRLYRSLFGKPRLPRMTPRTTTVDYQFYEPHGGHRFYVAVSITPPGSSAVTFYALVDTGADDLILPHALLPRFMGAGLVISPSTIHTGFGSPSLQVLRGYTFLVDGQSVTADVVFSPSLSTASAVCGRVPLLRLTKDAGFRTAEWLRR